MGREAEAWVVLGGVAAQVKLLLESDVLILRKPFGLRIPRGDLTGALVQGEALLLQTPQGPLRADLGAAQAAAWAKALAKPPPTLAQKLGVSQQTPARAMTPLTDAALLAACADATVPDAAMGIAELPDLAALQALLAQMNTPGLSAVWCVTRKGKAAPFPESTLREALRGAGWIDTKTAAVSAELTATRFNRRADAV